MKFNSEFVHKNVPIKHLVTFKIGGNADYLYSADSVDALCDAVKYAKEKGLPYFILGGGSNVLVSDEGIEGLVIHNLSEDIWEVDKEKCQIRLSSGFELEALVSTAYREGYTGAEPFAGIPGTVGGAICGNAGAYGKSISDLLVSCDILTADGEIQRVDNSYMQFTYRMSRVKTEPMVLLSAVFQLEKGDKEQIKAKMTEIMKERQAKHPDHHIGCAGSYFKNLPPKPGETRRQAAGMYLDKVGAKELKVGGASVFEKHANFIINTGNATAKDVRELASLLKAKVKDELGITLEEEVRYIGRW